MYDEPQRLVEVARRAHANMRLPDRGPWLPWDLGKPQEQWTTTRIKRQQTAGLAALAKKYGGVLLDDTQAETTGSWSHSTHSKPFVGDGYLTDGNSEKGAKSVCFRPKLPKAGAYEVRLAYTPLNNRAANTPVTIRTLRGERTVRVNQQARPEFDGLFHSLGRFELDAGDATAIVISNAGADGFVIVDALLIVP
ncbi:MAG: hypothetical protein N2689_11385 [Verrucomicrobiae bacterium]|nr:hypothetical protein [Verrucomicrobiae bacterium]